MKQKGGYQDQFAAAYGGFNFIDFTKAFDSLHRPSRWKIMEFYGFPAKIISIIKDLYDGSECCVKTNDGQTDWFKIMTGVRQGCILSPLLFGIAIDWVMKNTIDEYNHGVKWIGEDHLGDLDFADDIALMSESIEEMQIMTNNVANKAGAIGLKINGSKTETMEVGDLQENINITLEGVPLNAVNGFTYLGSYIAADGEIGDEISRRTGKASAAFRSLNKIWKSKKISLSMKLKLYNSNVISVLLYSAETWQLKKTQERKLDAFDSRCLRNILGIKWSDHITNIEVRSRSNQPYVTDILRKRRLKWFGHVQRLPESRIAHQVFQWQPEGRRPRGRPKTTWKHTVERDLGDRNTNWEEACRLSRDRGQWSAFIASCASGHRSI